MAEFFEPRTPERAAPPRIIPASQPPRYSMQETPMPGGARDDPLHHTPGAFDHPAPGAAPGQQEELTYVWGTGIAVEIFKDHFRQFLTTFKRDPRDAIPHYYHVMGSMRESGGSELEMDFTELAAHAPELFNQTTSRPSECLQMMASVAEELFRAHLDVPPGSLPADFTLTVAPKNLPASVSLRDLGPQHIETLVSIRGMVVRTSKLIPEVRIAFFECWICKFQQRSSVDRGRIFEPVRCEHCGKQYSYQMKHNLCVFEDKQIIRVQEAPENLAEGETPVTASVVVYGDWVDSVVPGDRVIVSGILRAAPVRLNSNTRIVRSVFRVHLDAVHIERTSKSSKIADIDLTHDTQLIDAVHRLSKRDDIDELLVRSLAPSVWGHNDVKKGILCQLFGGTVKEFRHGRFRSELNVIMCGDPGVAKSQLLTQVHRISPRGIYTSGKGSSSVGLTAFVVRDSDTGEFVLEPGALVLSDRGVCCIDEFDKMDEATRSILHEVMEQQTLSIAKAGIIAQLNARTSILAAANPKESQWNPNMNIVENLQIEPTLLSRFDLIFLLLDKQNEADDRLLASHVIAMYKEVPTGPSQGGGTPDTLSGEGFAQYGGFLEQTTEGELVIPSLRFTQYIAYARANCSPLLSEEADIALQSAFVELRRIRSGGKTVAATLRQLESMIRLSESRARMRLSTTVTRADVEEAKSLIMSALKDSATDPRTGLINMDIFAAPDLGKTSIQSCMIRLRTLIESKYITVGKKSATMQELRHLLHDAQMHSGQRQLTAAEFTEMISMMAGGDVVSSFTATTVSFTS